MPRSAVLSREVPDGVCVCEVQKNEDDYYLSNEARSIDCGLVDGSELRIRVGVDVLMPYPVHDDDLSSVRW